MTKMFKPILTELFWLILSFLTTILTSIFVFGSKFLFGTTDVYLYDTYFVFSAWTLIMPLFLFTTFIVFLVKESSKSFSRTIPNLIILLSGLLLIILLIIANKEFIKLGTESSGEWTVYPPLSALAKTQEATKEEDQIIRVATNLLTALQLLVTVLLLVVSYCWGKKSKAVDGGL